MDGFTVEETEARSILKGHTADGGGGEAVFNTSSLVWVGIVICITNEET